jgi:hypothetical protein
MRLLVRFIGACFLTAAFVWMFYLLHMTTYEAFFVTGFEFGQQDCQSAYKGGMTPDATSVYP